MDKEGVRCPFKGISFSHNKRVSKSQRHKRILRAYYLVKGTYVKEHMLYNSNCITFWKSQRDSDNKKVCGCHGLEVGSGRAVAACSTGDFSDRETLSGGCNVEYRTMCVYQNPLGLFNTKSNP